MPGQHRMRRITRFISIVFLASLAFVILGTVWAKNEIFPYRHAASYYDLFFGEALQTPTTPWEQLQNDLGFFPYAHAVVTDYQPPENREFETLEVPGLAPERDAPRIYIDAERRSPGLTLVSGVHDHAEGLHAVLLLDERGRLLHRWTVSDSDIGVPDLQIRPHGLVPLPDGSIVIAKSDARSLTRYDACSVVLWRLEGNHHHSVRYDGEGYLWAWDWQGMVKVRASDGEPVLRIEFEDIVAANSDSDVFGIREVEYWSGPEWAYDPLHGNDIDPLTAERAAAFPMFEVGDLLVSYRSINLIMVLDPDTLEIKWWRHGAGRRQHDPDWGRDGRIVFFDNNMHRGFSRIRAIDPVTYEVETLVPGEPYDFYTQIMGQQQVREDGAIMIASSYQGRAFEVAPDGRVVFEYINAFRDSDNRFGVVSDAQVLPLDFYEEIPSCD